MDVVEQNGVRTCTFYVPYWIVSKSILTLQYQHDTRITNNNNNYAVNSSDGNDKNDGSRKMKVKLNGIDCLAPDQEYTKQEQTANYMYTSLFNLSSLTDLNTNISDNSTNNNNSNNNNKNEQKDKGSIVGESKNPIRGFPDILNPPIIEGVHRNRKTNQINEKTTMNINESTINNKISKNNESNENNSKNTTSNDTTAFQLMLCGYTVHEDKIARIRVRARGTEWSAGVSPDMGTGGGTLECK